MQDLKRGSLHRVRNVSDPIPSVVTTGNVAHTARCVRSTARPWPVPTRLRLLCALPRRFSMVLHRESREFSVLVLIPGKKRKEGLTLRPAAAPGSAYRFRAVNGHATGSSISMPMLAGRLSRPDFGLDRPSGPRLYGARGEHLTGLSIGNRSPLRMALPRMADRTHRSL